MDILTTVAASLLPISRGPLAAAFKQLRQGLGEASALDELWAAAGRREPLPPDTRDDVLQQAAWALREAERGGIRPLTLGDAEYPPLLGCTADPPPVLWVRGEPASLGRPAVAIVGSRAATAYALQVAERLGSELADRGMVVVSGLARGVDSAAHRGCLAAGGTTVAVLGSGVDRVYPAEHRDLASRVAQRGAVIAELAPGTPPLPEHFPLRNRIISGISLAAVVVEASEGSGSLITARYALDQGRDVLAVPGSVLSGRNRGSHALLKDGAKVVEGADDILDELGWPGARPPGRASKPSPTEPLLARMEPGEAYELDALAAATGMSTARLLARLAELELAGTIEVSAGRFLRRRLSRSQNT